MINLLKETLLILEKYGKSLDDVVWVGCSDFEIPKDNFVSLACVADYNQGYGLVEVAEDLIVVGKDWWLCRCEYDGSEWWKFNTLPNRPKTIKETPALTIHQADDDDNSWASLRFFTAEPLS